jgi:hypothetical protein
MIAPISYKVFYPSVGTPVALRYSDDRWSAGCPAGFAVNGPRYIGFEWHFTIFPAIITDGLIHRAGCSLGRRIAVQLLDLRIR